jgi:hypothetical protein
MNTSKVPEEFTISVSEEIKRFQQEINKVTDENVNFPSWKKERIDLNVKSESVNCCKYSSKDSPPDLPPRRKPGSKESIKAPQLPPKMKKGMENPGKPEHSLEIAHMIQPKTTQINLLTDDTLDDTNRKDNDGQHNVSYDPIEEKYIPILPSVKKLANKFQIMQENENKQILLTKVSFKSV